MANCVNYNCFDDPLDEYHENECGEALPGGACSIILLECNHQMTDPTANQINTEIQQNRATLITGCYIDITAPTPIMSTTVIACKEPKPITYERGGVYKNENVSADGVEFHKPMFAGRTFGGMIIYEWGTKDSITPQITWIDEAITFTGGRILPGLASENQRFEGAYKYKAKYDADIYPVPAGIF